MLEKGLKEVGFSNILVLFLSFVGLKKVNGLEGMNFDLLKKFIVGVIYGDLLSKVFYRVRLYEKVKGSVDEFYKKWF